MRINRAYMQPKVVTKDTQTIALGTLFEGTLVDDSGINSSRVFLRIHNGIVDLGDNTYHIHCTITHYRELKDYELIIRG